MQRIWGQEARKYILNRENLIIDTVEEFLSVYIFEKIIIILVNFFYI